MTTKMMLARHLRRPCDARVVLAQFFGGVLGPALITDVEAHFQVGPL